MCRKLQFVAQEVCGKLHHARAGLGPWQIIGRWNRARRRFCRTKAIGSKSLQSLYESLVLCAPALAFRVFSEYKSCVRSESIARLGLAGRVFMIARRKVLFGSERIGGCGACVRCLLAVVSASATAMSGLHAASITAI